MKDVLFILNSGSSSLKFSVFQADNLRRPLVQGQLQDIFGSPRFRAMDAHGRGIDETTWATQIRLGHQGAIEFLFQWGRGGILAENHVIAAGHRVVHGGRKFTQPVRVDAAVMTELEALVPLAPLHQPQSLAAIRAVASMQPQLPQVACFDTAFHHTQPPVARNFALPRHLTDEGIQRYGFHGLSYEYIASVLPEFDPAAAAGRTVVAHLGNGASMCAMQAGRSIATTMGLTALDGLPMGTRCGSLDPGVLLYLMDQHQLGARDLERLLYHESGLLGVSGVSSDMRTLLDSTDPRAAEAIDLFTYRIGRELGSLAAALCGLDAVVFTGGIGEHAVPIREKVCRAAAWLGIQLDVSANEKGGPRITRPGSTVSAWVIPTSEERMIARHALRVLESR